MKQHICVILLLACLCWQCKDKKDPMPQSGEIKKIDVLEFTVPGVDPKNITVGEDLIVVRLPENYSKGNYIKPEIIFGSGYSSKSPLLDGIAFKGQEITLTLESNTRQSRSFNVIVVPHKAIELAEPAKNMQLTIQPEALITTSFDLSGTKETINESGKLVYSPLVRFTDKVTGKVALELYPDSGYPGSGKEKTFVLPDSTLPGEYIAEVVWGSKSTLLSSQLVVRPGPSQFKRGSWRMLEGDKYFEVRGFNFSSKNKYEAIIYNDFITPQRIPLNYAKPGTLSGNLPANIGLGNYKITYLENGKERQPYLERMGIDRYSGDDNFYIVQHGTQPIARILTQPSRRSSFQTYQGFDLPYFPSASEISRQEPILVYTLSSGAFPDRNELVLVDHITRKEYALPYSGDVYHLFDGFMSFLYFPVAKNVPDGKYEVYIVRGTEKSGRYSQIITLK